MSLEVCSLFSGSSGNATYMASGDTRVLIDAGLSGRMIMQALEAIKVLPETLSAILVSHEHLDHIKGVGVLSRKYRIPVYANEATWEKMHRQVGEIAPGYRRVFETDSDFYVGSLAVMPISVSHDAADPVAFRVYASGRSASVATDMGVVSKKVMTRLAGSDFLILESNHDEDMLRHNGRYSDALKRRILGSRGHLSNDSCGKALLSLYETGVGTVMLGHLSEENNTPELAMRTVSEMLVRQGLRPGIDVLLEMTWRDHAGGYYRVE